MPSGGGGREVGSRLRAKVVLPLATGHTGRGQAQGWGRDEPKEAEGEASK